MTKADEEFEVEDERLPFGELAVLEEMITRDHLAALLARQADHRYRMERNVRIGTLLVREGYLSKKQGRRILRIQKDYGPIDGYQLLEHLGSGGMGSVFRTIREATAHELAVKILPPRATHDARYRTRFLREASLLKQLDHPNLVKCYDQGESNDHLFYAMELVPGRTGRALLKADGALPENRLRESLRKMLGAMDHYWELRIVHRDIKPENIMFTPDWEVKLTDLGLSRQLDDGVHITRVGKTLGTPLYISPELAQGRSDIDIRSDLYSLGATFFHLACGVPPFMAVSQGELLKQHVEDPAPSPRLKNPRLSEGMETIILKLLEKRPDDRFDDPKDVLDALDRLERGETPVVERRRRRSSSSREAIPVRRRGWSSGSSSGTRTGWQPKAPRRGAYQALTPLLVLIGFSTLFALGVLLGTQTNSEAVASQGQVAARAAEDEGVFKTLLDRDPAQAARVALDYRRDLPGRIFRIEAVVGRLAAGDSSRPDLEQQLARARADLDAEALAALDELRGDLIELVAARRFDEARALLRAFPTAYRKTTAGEGYDELGRELELEARDARELSSTSPEN